MSRVGVAASRAVLLAALLVVGSCSDDQEQFDLPPPGTSMCGGLADARLIVEIRERAGYLDRVTDDVEINGQIGEYPSPSLGCGIGSMGGYGVSTVKVSLPKIALAARPTTVLEPRFVPLRKLAGRATPEGTVLLHRCSKGPHAGWLHTLASISYEQEDPRVRLLLAQLAVDGANRARDVLGCGDPPMPLPQNLLPVPVPRPLGGVERVCGLVPPAFVEDAVPDRRGWTQLRTPGQRPLIELCLLESPDGQSVRFETSRGVFAESARVEPEAPLPRIDHECGGNPVSYRMETEPPLDEGVEQELLDTLASAAARQAGCPLP